MAIPVIELVMSLRYALGDMQGLNISDYELIEPINQASSLLYGRLSERYVHAVLKKLAITLAANTEEYALPGDFVRIHQVISDDAILIPTSTNPPVTGSYRIVGNTLYARPGTYTIEYYYIPARIKKLSDNLDVSASMRTWIEQISLMMFKKELQAANELCNQCESILAGRAISHFENTGPVQILGGRT